MALIPGDLENWVHAQGCTLLEATREGGCKCLDPGRVWNKTIKSLNCESSLQAVHIYNDKALHTYSQDILTAGEFKHSLCPMTQELTQELP